METICVDNEYYDPYFILGVTGDDPMEHITKAFRRKAKKYHPDKATPDNISKYETRFKIVIASYEYIKNKRTNQLRQEKHTPEKAVKTKLNHENLAHFNTQFVDDSEPNSFGYGEHEHYINPKAYENFKNEVINQFKGKKFTVEEFNRIFEYLKQNSAGNEETSLSLVHKSTDGFYGYNTSDTGNCSQVSSYNGLMITGDELGQQGVGYWGNNYGDYQKSFSIVKNPEQQVEIPENFKMKTDKRVNRKELHAKIKSRGHDDVRVNQDRNKEQEALYHKTLEDLIEQERQDKAMIFKYAGSKYKREMIQQAMNGRLEQSASLLYALQEHYNPRQIKANFKSN